MTNTRMQELSQTDFHRTYGDSTIINMIRKFFNLNTRS